MVGAAALAAGCGAHGAHTEEALQDATDSIYSVRAATQYEEAERLYRVGDFENARVKVNSAIALKPDASKGFLLLSRIEMELGDFPAALAALDLATDPREAELHFTRALIFELMGRTDDAITAYERGLEQAPDDEDARMALSELHVDEGAFDHARRVLTEDPPPAGYGAGARQALGHLTLLEGDEEAALRCFREAATLAPKDASIRHDLLALQVRLGRFREALQTIIAIERLGEAAYEPRFNTLCAIVFLECGQVVRGRDLLLERLAEPGSEGDISTWKLVIDAAVLLDDDRLLERGAAALIRIAPEDPEGFIAMSLVHRRRGELPTALETVRRARSIAPLAETARLLEELILDQLGG